MARGVSCAEFKAYFLNRVNTVQELAAYFFNNHFNIIFPSACKVFQVLLFYSGFSTMHTMHAACPAILLLLIWPHNYVVSRLVTDFNEPDL